MATMKPFSEWDSQLAADFVKPFEGCEYNAYRCPAGVWTIGYGHTLGVKPGDKCTQPDAEMYLLQDLIRTQKEFSPYVKVPVSKDQFIAIMDWVYNIGTAKTKDSTLVRQLNQGQYRLAANQFLRWKYANGKVLPGLVKRREAEKAKFLEGTEGD